MYRVYEVDREGKTLGRLGYVPDVFAPGAERRTQILPCLACAIRAAWLNAQASQDGGTVRLHVIRAFSLTTVTQTHPTYRLEFCPALSLVGAPIFLVSGLVYWISLYRSDLARSAPFNIPR